MSERERYRFPQVLPPIYEEDLLLARQEVDPLVGDDNQAFTIRIFEELARPEGDPELIRGIRAYQTLRSFLPRYDPDAISDINFGAAYFASILGPLEELGYTLPKISPEVAVSPLAPFYSIALDLESHFGRKKGPTRTDAKKAGKPLSELQEWRRTMEKAVKVHNIKDLMSYDIHSENPDVMRTIFYRLSSPAMRGAADVYNLKRRQYLLNQRQ